MKIEEAIEAGCSAFNNGIKRAPYMDSSFADAVCAIGDSASRCGLMRAWLSSWDVENLKAAVE